MSEELGVTVKKKEDIAEWYQQVVLKAGFADYTPVKGMIAYRPLGYGVWELIMQAFDERLKAHGVKNVYFPVAIPEGLLTREAEHFEGFAPEVFWITLGGEEPLEERLALRPTSETIIHTKMGEWLQSHRDLPMRLNQWCTMYRCESKMTKPFIRGREILWTETHTAFATRKEADEETEWGMDAYGDFIEEFLAMPVVRGRKTDSDKFAGAEYTLAVESLMPDGKALQNGTSHLLSQHFAEAYGVKFLDQKEKWQFAWLNSYGLSTRLIGGLILLHGDDRGAVLPPRVAPTQVVVVPINAGKKGVMAAARRVTEELRGFGLRVELDDREGYTPGWKFNDWELRGVPLRVEVGPKDVAKGAVMTVRRDDGSKRAVAMDKLGSVAKLLDRIQESLFKKAKEFLDAHTVKPADAKALAKALDGGNWAVVPHCGSAECEESLSGKAGGGPRLIPGRKAPSGSCINCQKKAKYWLYWGRSY